MADIGWGGESEDSVGMDFGGVSSGGFGGPADIGGALTDPGSTPTGYSTAGLDDYGGANSVGGYLSGLWNTVGDKLTGGSGVSLGLGPIAGLFAGILGGIYGNDPNKFKGGQSKATFSGAESSFGVSGLGGGDRGEYQDDDEFISQIAQDAISGMIGGTPSPTPISRRKSTSKPSGLYGSEEAPGSFRRYLQGYEDDDLAENLAFGKEEFTRKLF